MSPLIRRRSVWYAAAGGILAIGAPTGLLILREIYSPRPVTTEILSDRLTYLYVLFATVIVLAFLGFALGRQADQLKALSETDVLTGLPNRRALRQRLAMEFRRAVPYGTPVSLLLVDIDGLKQLNDKMGMRPATGSFEASQQQLPKDSANLTSELGGADTSSRSSHLTPPGAQLVRTASGWLQMSLSSVSIIITDRRACR
jgi:diguanylate cyclase with GGDEF domain